MSEVVKLKHPTEELSEQDYQEWKRHPMSKILFQYLRDKSKDYLDGVMQRWTLDQLSLAEENEFKYRIKLLEELDNLKFKDIKFFYDSFRNVETNE